MSSPLICSPISPENKKEEVIRLSANYHPSIWGDHFLLSPTDNNMISNTQTIQRIEVLKEEVKKLLQAAAKNALEQMNLINTIQHLGVAYHFEKEIEEALQIIYNAHTNHLYDDDDDDLYTIALRFFLLRLQGYNVSSDAFLKFKEAEGGFKQDLVNDARGMLYLYEAAYLSVQGEEILDEALIFTTTHLTTMITHLSSPLKEEVEHALYLPFHRGMPRLKARQYISIYEEETTRNDSLLELAKLDFNLLQSLHQRELKDVSRWWNDVDFKTKVPFARDRLVEGYYWILGVYFEPQYSMVRVHMTKMISITTVIDDVYDMYGTFEELQLFSDAIERWDVAAADKLPEYMSVCYLSLLDIFKELEEEMIKEGRSFCVYYAKESMKMWVRASFQEANWYYTGYAPTFDEYLNVATMSTAYPMLCVQAFIGIGEVATKEAFDWINSVPKIAVSAAQIGRLLDDMLTDEIEKARGAAGSSVVSYMVEHGVTEKEACDVIQKLITIEWKDLNQECLKQNPFPLVFLKPILNFARMAEVFFRREEGYTNATGCTKENITSLFVNPISIP